MLDIQNVEVQVEDTSVLAGVSMQFSPGKNYCVLGKNGSGKSSLALSIMGHPSYEVTNGDMLLAGETILDMEADERAKKGIFLAFQSIPEVKGVKLFEFLRTIYNSRREKKESFVSFKRIILPYLEELGIDKEFLWRDLNVGFSGGERRKIEILQLKLLEPKYIFLDEVDSGLDVDAFRSVAKLLQQQNTDENCFVIITHYFSILDYLAVDEVIVLEQ
jgi:Fe-S cluster assembly ATP-binding protein